MTQYELTPADVADLRCWRKTAGSAPDGSNTGYPFIVVSPSDGKLYLHSLGHCVAGELRPEVMCALLLNERLEPGYCRRIVSPDCTIEEALRTPHERQLALRRRLENSANARAHADEAAELLRRRRTHLDVTKIDLFD